MQEHGSVDRCVKRTFGLVSFSLNDYAGARADFARGMGLLGRGRGDVIASSRDNRTAGLVSA